MAQQGTVAVERMGGVGARRVEGAFRGVYAEAFAGAPYHEGPDDVAAAFARFPALTRRAGFRAALARDEDGQPVGMTYGYCLAADAVWWDHLVTPVPDAMRREDGHRTFGLIELAVRPSWQGRGVARLLHRALLDGLTAERVLLNAHPEGSAASAAYRAWGYRKVGEAIPWDGADLHDVMLLALR